MESSVADKGRWTKWMNRRRNQLVRREELLSTRRETCHKTKGMPDERFDHILPYHITYETLIRMLNWKNRAFLMTM
jgi:hypothetical protein